MTFKQFVMVALTTVFPLATMAQSSYDTLRDEKNASLVYKGGITFANLLAEPSFKWMADGIEKYQPDGKVMQHMNTQLKGCRFLVFMGTWCEDSQNIIPRFYKVLQSAGYPLTDVLMYGLDRAKTTGSGIEKTYNISLVPTIIIYRNNAEIGRIIESVQTTVEGDIEKVVMGK
jgi:thiol-disulfide isomerase/thioredoxin